MKKMASGALAKIFTAGAGGGALISVNLFLDAKLIPRKCLNF